MLLSVRVLIRVCFREGTALKSKTHPSAPTPTTAHQQGGEAAICCRKCAAAPLRRRAKARRRLRRFHTVSQKTSANLRFSQGKGAGLPSLLWKKCLSCTAFMEELLI